jgi:ABC-type glycerol-3-phosphate transport system substrate-binding protein
VQFWYNKGLFDEVGVEPPATWDEFLAVNDALLAAGYAPLATESDIAFYQIDFLTYYVERVKGPGFLRAAVEDPTGEMWNDPVFLEAAQATRDLWDRGHIPEETVGYLWPAGQQTLGFGEAGAELVGSWLPIELSDIVEDGFEWGAFNFPAVEGGAGSNNDLQVALLAFMILKDSEHPAEAFEFLRFMMTKENMQQMADEALVGVTRLDVAWADAIADGAEAAANAENVMGLSDGTVALYPEFVNNILYVNWRDLFLGELTPEEYVAKMAADAANHWEGKPVEEAAAAEEVAEEPLGAAELVYWSMWNETEPQAQVIQGWIDEFEQTYPDISIEAVWNGRQNQTLVRTALESGTKIDFVDQDSDPLAGGLMLEGQAYPLDDYLGYAALDEEGPVKDVFTPGVLDLFAAQDGTIYQWPYVYNTVQFWYNKGLFEEVGVEPPATWDEFLAVNDALLEAGYAPLAAESDIAFYQIDFLTYYVERVKGPGFLRAAVEDPTGEMWNDPVFLEAAQATRELWDRGHIPEETVGYLWPAGQQTLGFGEAGAELVGSWLPIELSDIVEEGFEWGAFNFPAVEGGVGSNNDLQVALLAFMILKDTEHPRESFEFLRFLATKEHMQQMADEALVGVTRKDVTWADAIADGAEAAANAENVMGLSDGTVALYPEFVNNVLYVNWRDLFLGELTPEEYVAKMAADAAEHWAGQ